MINGTIGENLKNIMLRKRIKAQNDVNGSVYVNFRNRPSYSAVGSQPAAPWTGDGHGWKGHRNFAEQGVGNLVSCVGQGHSGCAQMGQVGQLHALLKVSVLKYTSAKSY